MNLVLVSQMDIAKAARETGLCLTGNQLRDIADAESACLSDCGRISFGECVASLVVREFAGSPYLPCERVDEALIKIIEAFYELREGLPASITDIEIVELLRDSYDHEAAGDEGLAAELSRVQLSNALRHSWYEISDSEGNVYRWDPGEWRDDVMADGWYGEKWDDDGE